MIPASATPQYARINLCLLIATAAALITVAYGQTRLIPSDFAQNWTGARALVRGLHPYAVIGPGRSFDWPFPLLYPLPAVVAALPFSPLPLSVADPLFVGLGALTLAWALTRGRLHNPQLTVFASAAFLNVMQSSQWSPWLTAAVFLPWLGALFACKPTLGLALSAAYPSRRAIIAAALFGLVTIVIWPWWFREWLAALPAGTHITELIRSPGGFLIAIVLLRWRRPDARLLIAMACIPQTPLMYEAVPLFLIVETWTEGWLLVALTIGHQVMLLLQAPYASYNAWMARSALLMVWWVYLPLTAIVLRRPNVSAVAASNFNRPAAPAA